MYDMKSCAYSIGVLTLVVGLVPLFLGFAVLSTREGRDRKIGQSMGLLVLGLLLVSNGIASLCYTEGYENMVGQFLGAPQITNEPAPYITEDGLAAYAAATTTVVPDEDGMYGIMAFQEPGVSTLLSVSNDKKLLKDATGKYPKGTRYAKMPPFASAATVSQQEIAESDDIMTPVPEAQVQIAEIPQAPVLIDQRPVITSALDQ